MHTETQHIEFKPGFNEDVIETLTAFANTKGGRVLVGVANNGDPVKGFTIGQESIQQWLNEIKMKTQPAIIPDEITIDDLLSNNYKSTPRNKLIADFFKHLGLIEKYGSGIGRIINYFKEENFPTPEFKNISGGFQVTVFSGMNIAAEKGTEKGTEKITGNQQVMIDSILQNPHITSEELASIVGIRADKIRINIQKLKAKGLLERVGPDKGGYWKINTKNI